MLKKKTEYGTVSASTFEADNGIGIAFGVYGEQSVATIESGKHGLVILLNEKALSEQGIEVIYVKSFDTDDLATVKD